MSYKILLVATLAVVALAEDLPHGNYVPPKTYVPEPYHDSDYHKDPPKYEFHYTVNDNKGNDYGHWESRNGDRTEGKYVAVLPDTRKQTVEYYVDGKSGFVAKVIYEGDPVYPKPKPYKPDHKPKHYE